MKYLLRRDTKGRARAIFEIVDETTLFWVVKKPPLVWELPHKSIRAVKKGERADGATHEVYESLLTDDNSE